MPRNTKARMTANRRAVAHYKQRPISLTPHAVPPARSWWIDAARTHFTDQATIERRERQNK